MRPLSSLGAAISDGVWHSGMLSEWCMQRVRITEELAQSARKGNVQSILIVLFGLFGIFLLLQILSRDDKMVVQRLVPAGSMCATQNDMYDDVKRLCQMGNSYAYAYLLHHRWVMCAPNMPGAKVLRKQQDEYGNFWYHPSDRNEVRSFYKTCVPTCADDRDTYHSSKRMCLVGNDVARVWLQGAGQSCQNGMPGTRAIHEASKMISDGNLWYKPEMSTRVADLYKTCHPTCAKGDLAQQDPTSRTKKCVVLNLKALSFLHGLKTYVCDSTSPGKSSLSVDRFLPIAPVVHLPGVVTPQQYWYSQDRGAQVEAWYTSCMRQQ